jgi:hypothetical protein
MTMIIIVIVFYIVVMTGMTLLRTVVEEEFAYIFINPFKA